MTRPTCRRCGGPLDLWQDEDGVNLICNNPDPIATDEEFERRWDSLDGDDVARLDSQLDTCMAPPRAGLSGCWLALLVGAVALVASVIGGAIGVTAAVAAMFPEPRF